MVYKYTIRLLLVAMAGVVTVGGGCVAGGAETAETSGEVRGERVDEVGEAACSAWASDVVPNSAAFQQQKLFYVYGSCLPSSLALWIADCANMQKINSTSSKVIFRCTPSNTKGWKSGVVKDKPGGTQLYSFDVSVY
jgi:hypothetical protein